MWEFPFSSLLSEFCATELLTFSSLLPRLGYTLWNHTLIVCLSVQVLYISASWGVLRPSWITAENLPSSKRQKSIQFSYTRICSCVFVKHPHQGFSGSLRITVVVINVPVWPIFLKYNWVEEFSSTKEQQTLKSGSPVLCQAWVLGSPWILATWCSYWIIYWSWDLAGSALWLCNRVRTSHSHPGSRRHSSKFTSHNEQRIKAAQQRRRKQNESTVVKTEVLLTSSLCLWLIFSATNQKLLYPF